jgi:hypothetical protein
MKKKACRDGVISTALKPRGGDIFPLIQCKCASGVMFEKLFSYAHVLPRRERPAPGNAGGNEPPCFVFFVNRICPEHLGSGTAGREIKPVFSSVRPVLLSTFFGTLFQEGEPATVLRHRNHARARASVLHEECRPAAACQRCPAFQQERWQEMTG